MNLHRLKPLAVCYLLSSASPSCNPSFLMSATERLCHLILGLIVLVRVRSTSLLIQTLLLKESTHNTPLTRCYGSAIISIHSMNVSRWDLRLCTKDRS